MLIFLLLWGRRTQIQLYTDILLLPETVLSALLLYTLYNIFQHYSVAILLRNCFQKTRRLGVIISQKTNILKILGQNLLPKQNRSYGLLQQNN